MKTFSSLFVIFLLLSLEAIPQITPEQEKEIDKLFIEWNKPWYPGGAISIAIDGRTVYSKAFGLASLEYLNPNTPQTIFNTGSVSKQFTAMGIVLLHLQEKISVDDDIRKYITDLPDFGDTITIRHLLHHTSGLRSLHALFELAGWRGDDARTNEDLYRIMRDQRDLNFKPGDEFLYCNTGYMLMAKIIEEVTGETFPEWMNKEVFEPLGMINTYAEDNYQRIVLNNATSYYTMRTGEFQRAVEFWGYVGSGNVHSTTADLLKWFHNFYDPQPGWEEAFSLMKTTNKLNNGQENNYAFGLFIDQYKGVPRIQHGGSIGGFRAFGCVFPENKLSIALLTNFTSSSVGQKVDRVTEIILADKIKQDREQEEETEKPEIIKLNKKELEKFTGNYWFQDNYFARKIYIRDDTLRYFRSENSESPIAPFSKNEFIMLGISADLRIRFDSDETGQNIMLVKVNGALADTFKFFIPYNPDIEELEKFVGEYFSPELKTSYFFSIHDGKLMASHTRHGNLEIRMLREHIFEGQSPLNLIEIEETENGKISGIRVSNGRVRNLWFEKRE